MHIIGFKFTKCNGCEHCKEKTYKNRFGIQEAIFCELRRKKICFDSEGMIEEENPGDKVPEWCPNRAKEKE